MVHAVNYLINPFQPKQKLIGYVIHVRVQRATPLVFQVGRVQARLVCSEAMLTPSFDIEQSEEFVILTIRVPYIKVGTSSLMHVFWSQ